MKTDMLLVCLVLSFCTSCTVTLADEGARTDSDDLEKARGLLTDFISARSDLPKIAACRIRGETVASPTTRYPFLQTDHIIFWAHDRESSNSYFGYGAYSAIDGKALPSRMWEQTLTSEKSSLRRLGVADHFDRLTDLRETTEDPPKHAFPVFDPFCLPMGGYGSYNAGKIAPDYPLLSYVLNAEAVWTDSDSRGNLVGVWEMNGNPGAFVEVTFDKLHGNMPSRVVWRLRSKVGASLEESRQRRIVEVTETAWTEVASDGKRHWVPQQYRSVYAGISDESRQVEKIFCYEWKLGTSARVSFPTPKDSDWRTPFVNLFEEELNSAFNLEDCGRNDG